MAQEAIEQKPYDHKVDVFSFGVLQWELLTGKVIEHKPSDHEVDVFTFGVLQWELLTGKGLRPTILRHTPPKLGELLERCWQQDPSLRPEFSKFYIICGTWPRGLQMREWTGRRGNLLEGYPPLYRASIEVATGK
nr:serine/threonine-protein kinase STY17-like [Quercus suber]XP_023920086.1 serine/threonine-protein kinase STY17-like [Quercus suber]XP_023920087.1 serine/threonine-protein kinase STY17-like [Quercus suber]XP_023920088.1 serine/threonine-protein kinase STY17-like [Quercus suber]XP_023920089.1 serine/threonine-protein kinase STY17-like [Quercus suber]POF00660.1 serine/threonine-protein kinase sty17 [Quercus suber]